MSIADIEPREAYKTENHDACQLPGWTYATLRGVHLGDNTEGGDTDTDSPAFIASAAFVI